MQNAAIPPKMPTPFGNSAGASYIRTVPTPSQIGIQDGAASFTTGFPPLNFLPISAGGVPPFGQDVNGMFLAITKWLRWTQAGAAIPFDNAFSVAINGYPKGAIIASATFGGWWLNNTEDNMTNPDTGGAGWVPLAWGQAPTYTRLTSGSGNYNPQANAPTGLICKRVRGILVGGGASGGSTSGSGNDGVISSFGGWTANPGIKGLQGSVPSGGGIVVGGLGGTGGANGVGTLINRVAGGQGCDGGLVTHNAGTLAGPLTYVMTAPGGTNPLGGGGGRTPAPNSGAGSLAEGSLAVNNTQTGSFPSAGGAGEFVEFLMPVTAALIAYAIGAGGAAPGGGFAAAAGALILEEQYQ